ncbi:hypothetical protein ACE1CB_29470 [Aerosakkonema sp. BLCC-F2]
MGFSGSFWFSNQANAQNAGTRLTQTIQRSDIARLNLTLNSQPNENYDTLIRRAEAAARDVAGRSFSQNAAIRGVAVTILGQNAGSIAPLLSLQVNRQNWISQPDTQRWATYFKNAPTLLGINTAPNVADRPGNGNTTQAQTAPNGTPVNGGQVQTTGPAGTNGATNLNNPAGGLGTVNGTPTTTGTQPDFNNINGTNGTNGSGLNGTPTTTGTQPGFNNTNGTNSNGFNGTGFGNTTGTPTTTGTQPGFNNTNGTNSNGFNDTGFGNTTGTPTTTGTQPGFNNTNGTNSNGFNGTGSGGTTGR